jgi:hypothetical protein
MFLSLLKIAIYTSYNIFRDKKFTSSNTLPKIIYHVYMLDYLEYNFYKGSTTVFHVFTMITWIRGSEKIYILEFESHVVLKLF